MQTRLSGRSSQTFGLHGQSPLPKRLFDLSVATTLLIAALPLLFMIAIALKCDHRILAGLSIFISSALFVVRYARKAHLCHRQNSVISFGAGVWTSCRSFSISFVVICHLSGHARIHQRTITISPGTLRFIMHAIRCHLASQVWPRSMVGAAQFSPVLI